MVSGVARPPSVYLGWPIRSASRLARSSDALAGGSHFPAQSRGMKGSLLAVGLAAAAAQSVVVLESTTDSQIAFGGAVINSYCQADVPPKFVAADVDPTHPDGTSLLPGTTASSSRSRM